MEVVGLLAPNSSIYDQTAPKDSRGGEKGQETNEVYEESAAIDCDQDAAAAPKYSGRDPQKDFFKLYRCPEADGVFREV